nr:hypothetical protein [Tanacetum cinerariifolium]
MIWHATGKCTEPGKMQHPVDGRAWKNFDTKYPDFTKEPRNVRLGLVADGFNPFDNLKNHREEEDQEGNNSSEITTDFVCVIYVNLSIITTVAETELGERAETEAVDSSRSLVEQYCGYPWKTFQNRLRDMGGTHVIKHHHGEPDLPPPPPVIDNTRQPHMSDMIALLNDLSYIPPNNEQNEPTQEDIGETSNEPTQVKRNEFEELYASANKELYPGCDYVTRLDFLAKFTYIKVKGKLTDSMFNDMLEFFQHVFPTMKRYKLSPSYYAIKKTFKTIGLGLQRLYKSSHTAKEMTWHATEKCIEPDLKVLWALKGVETIDVATGQKFNMRAMVLWTINNFPARSSSSGWSGQGYKASPTCNEDTPSVCVSGKTTYVSYRRFIKKPHKWRRSLEFNDGIKDGDPPRKFDRDQIQAQLARLPTRMKGKHPSYGGVKIKRNVLVELNWTKRLEKVGHSKWLVAWSNQKREVLEASGCVFFLTREQKKFCQLIKVVILPDGFESNFKHKVTDNDINITGLKSHDYHIMTQRLLPYGIQQYFPDEVTKPKIELCLFFKQICSATLMEDDMLKAQSKVVDILCNLELMYPPAFFDIMIHLVIHLPLEALKGGPIRPRWMFPFERFIKKLKGYVRNKAKPKGSIAEGYVAEEALTF